MGRHEYDRQCRCDNCQKTERNLFTELAVEQWLEGLDKVRKGERLVATSRPAIRFSKMGVTVVAEAKLTG